MSDRKKNVHAPQDPATALRYDDVMRKLVSLLVLGEESHTDVVNCLEYLVEHEAGRAPTSPWVDDYREARPDWTPSDPEEADAKD